MKRLRIFPASAALLNLMLVTTAYGWAPIGHKTVAYIAQDHLTPKTKQKVFAILGLGRDENLADVSLWADEALSQPAYKHTVPWHYINLDVRADVKPGGFARYGHHDNNVVHQIQNEIKALKTVRNPAKQQEHLKFLIHFVADLHCPLHCSNDQDKGGNLKEVNLPPPDGLGSGHTMRLHAVWDNLIEFHDHDHPRVLATELERKITHAHSAAWQAGEAPAWAYESYLIAKKNIYTTFPTPGPSTQIMDLPKDYFSQMRPIAEMQLEKAGIRLAFILNQLYDPQPSSSRR